MSNNLPNLISWKELNSCIGNESKLTKVAAKNEKDSDYDAKGNKKVVVDSGGREFGPRKGLEGPFRAKGGHKGVYYYDSKEGKYYCPYTDMYLDSKPGEDSIKESSIIYDAVCKHGDKHKVISIIADSITSAFKKAAEAAPVYNLNWNETEVEISPSNEPWIDVLKMAKRRHERMSLEAMVKKLIESHISKNPEDMPEDEDSNKLSIYLGQIYVILDIAEKVTGHEVEREDLLNAIAKEAAKHKVDLEIGGHPEEAYLLMNKPVIEEMKTAAKKKKSKAGKNKPTNPSLWARAKAAAKAKFDVYPSAYSNGWAVQWYKKRGGGWRKDKK